MKSSRPVKMTESDEDCKRYIFLDFKLTENEDC